MDKEKTQAFVDENYEKLFVEPLMEFVKIDNLSPAYDKEYFTNGKNEKAIELVKAYAEEQKIDGLSFEVFSEPNKPAIVTIVVEGQGSQNLMLYGHLDKQPHMEGWDEGLGPCNPVIKNGLLDGRGSSDDGYAPFAALLAIKNVQLQGGKLPRICLVLETEEESGSPNLLYLMDKIKDRTGAPDICICMDSGACDVESLWLTSSLRGVLMGDLKVEVLQPNKGAHSGLAGGVIPESFRIAQQLLNRLEDLETKIVNDAFQVDIPDYKREEAKEIAESQGNAIYEDFSWAEGVQPLSKDNIAEMYLNNVWRAQLSITGASGLPDCSIAGNVLRPSTTLRFSIRLPPPLDASKIADVAVDILTKDPPFGAKVSVSNSHAGGGWLAKQPAPWVKEALDVASNDFYGKPCRSYGVGGSIPFLGELGKKFPDAQILAIGVLASSSNAHNPNENIDLEYTKKLICSLSHIVAAAGAH